MALASPFVNAMRRLLSALAVCCLSSCLASTPTQPNGPPETMASFAHPRGEIRLLTAKCAASAGTGQQAVQDLAKGGQRQGCWGVNPAGNPVISWADGAEQVLDGNRVRLSPRFAALIDNPARAAVAAAPSALPAPSVPATPSAQSTSTPSAPSATPAADHFPRPVWCPRARLAHERLICADRELATRDLQLGRAWRDLRPQLGASAQSRIAREYFQRVKRCAADKACVTRSQLAQLQRYETRVDLRSPDAR